MTPDIINGAFEFGMALMLSLSVRRLYRDKRVQGVSFWAVFWPMMWGYWNLFYYPHLDQWWSFMAGIGVVSANTTWVLMAWYYGRRHDD
jgi:hypothetical protein